MSAVNKVFILGNLTRDPEVRYTPKGTAVAELGLAINEKRRTDAGDLIEKTVFVDVTTWGKTAENAGRFLSKGRAVHVEGRLELDTWEDKESGQKRSRLKVIASAVQFLSGGKSEDRPAAPSPDNRPPSQSGPREPALDDMTAGDEDDIPF